MKDKHLISALVGIIVSLLMLSYQVYTLKQTRPTTEEVAAMLEPESKIYEMLNARMDCERTIPRTQECVLVYDYVPVQDYPELANE